MTSTDRRGDARVRQIVLATPDRAFQAFVTPDDIGQWMFGPNIRDERVMSLTTDPRDGGTFSFKVERRGETLDHRGVYKRFLPGRELVFTWIVNGPPANGDWVAVDFKPLMLGTEIVLSHELSPDWVEARAKIEAAWGKMLLSLARHVAKR